MAGTGRATPTRESDAGWEAWRDRLVAQFDTFDVGGVAAYLYMLADARANPGLDKLLVQVPLLEWESLWGGSVLESYTDIAPYLIGIDRFAFDDSRDLGSRFVRRLWRESSGRHMLTWIWSPFPIRSLAAHFRSFCRYSTPDKRAYFLHFYDNRILARLRGVWSAEQAQAFLSPCVEIWHRDRDSNEIVWRNDAGVADAVVDAEQVMTIEQHMTLLHLGRADKLAMQLRTMYGAMLDDFTDLALYRRISEQLERAGRYRIADDDDLLNYVSKGVVISPRFDEHPVIRGRLERAMSGEQTFREALSDIDAEVLRETARIASDSDAAGGTSRD
ncbi:MULTISPECIES: DUF4123 domain-containing protein [Burkholderia cepacia complex]|uniref:DUF4123 domain-containing protein n=1 Tax=Burkholderia cepacia complex TaxID=87882 RepID=UPI0006792D72|nr:DUF4123 domain-containing protein [Burkholderia cenocepacia]KWU24872.1 hypothetical protein AS149_06110 [Burkholderia cenocepacia]CAG2307608.1 hypothetical protein BCCR75389_03419 [Burkholderia cenocepacia]CAG2307627.1 hypothetical protein BCCR75384_03434 [Burkholderia cenocepacia]CAG2307678.1 hypothetical protein BCCR75386_03435 [Burkholderia cenocepacia]CAG2307704.1 hypothetical protein BCCR12632_03437 [Burkholderia cenocepacia]